MAIVRKYKSIVTDFINPAPGLYQVKFSSLSGKFNFRPGQFLHLALDEYNPSLQWPESRCFSIQNSPSSDYIKITFSVKGKFTQRMAEELHVGKEIWIKLPYGEFLHNCSSDKNCVFIAGGTGITPFLSLYTESSFSTLKNPVLYLGLREEKYHIYQEELNVARKINSNFVINTVYEDTVGMLNIENIFKNYGNRFVYFLSGPQQMLLNFKQYLSNTGVSQEDIITDDWE